MESRTKTLLLAAVLAALGFVAIWYWGVRLVHEPSGTAISYGTTTRKVWVEFDFGDGKKRKFEGEVDDGSYSLQNILISVSKSAGVPIEFKKGSISAIDRISGTWHIYQAGALESRPPAKLIVQGGDTVSIRLEK